MLLQHLARAEQQMFLELAHRAAWIDGTLAREEQKMLAEFRVELGLDEATYPIRGVEVGLACAAFASMRSKRIAFVELVAMVLADGVTHISENALLLEVQAAFEIDDAAVVRTFVWVQKLLDVYAEGMTLFEDQPEDAVVRTG